MDHFTVSTGVPEQMTKRVDHYVQMMLSEHILVGGFKHFFHFIYGIILPIDELIFFKMLKTINQPFMMAWKTCCNCRPLKKTRFMDDIVLDFYVGKTMPETTHVLMVYTSHLW